MKAILVLLISVVACFSIYGQYTQTIRGTVTDKDSHSPLIGANVVLVNSNPSNGTTSDKDGNYHIANVPIGRQSVQVSYVGYKTAGIQNLIIGTGKEVIINVELEETVTQTGEVKILSQSHKDQPVNKMAAISARSFTVEETEKYAGSRGDVARMAMNFAGVATANDSRNDIVIRGNSPSGLLWRLDDIEIPNPNHFANEGTTGGPVGMLNNNMLLNSDFYTGAFPAEFGNALSGVFDLKMRTGNNEKHEFLAQVGFNGFELGAEGPLSSNHKASYLFDYRYSTLDLVSKFINFGTSGVPKYQDLSFKINFPLQHGRITIFGLGGISKISMLASTKNSNDMYSDSGQNLYNGSNMGTVGVSFMHFINERSYFRLSLSVLTENGSTTIDTIDNFQNPHRYLDAETSEFKASLSGVYSIKNNSRFNQKIGFTIDRLGFSIVSNQFNRLDNKIDRVIDFSRSLSNGDNLLRTWYEAVYHFTDNLSIHPGLNVSYLDMNSSYSIEPRIAAVWQYLPDQKLSIGYGLHSRMQAYSTYFYGTLNPDGSLTETNKALSFTKSHQFVIGYDKSIGEHARLKTEIYYQDVFDVPVQMRSSSFSMLNTGASFGLPATDSLVNKGKGRNFGIELTLEKFLYNNDYYLVTLSLYDSKYKGSDEIWRNTAFNGSFILNALYGREFPLSANSALTLDLKAGWGGGNRYSPIDLAESRRLGYTSYIESTAFSKQFPNYFKGDIKFGFRLNGKRMSQEWQIYVENFSNHQNVLMQQYSRITDNVRTIYQLGIFPMMLYRLHF